MKASAFKATVVMVVTVGVFALFIDWYPFVFSLCWPSLALARVGLAHSWVASAVLVLGGSLWLGVWSRRQAWIRLVFASLVLSVSYCLLALLFVRHFSVPLPLATPYDSSTPQRVAYLQAFDLGYREGALGVMRTYCFSPEAETRGFYDGCYQGSIVWYRMFGLSMPDRTKRLFKSSAAIDGVRSELK